MNNQITMLGSWLAAKFQNVEKEKEKKWMKYYAWVKLIVEAGEGR